MWQLLVCVVALLKCTHGTALDDYIAKPDSNYAFEDTHHVIKLLTSTGYVLNMTSQQWLTPHAVDRSIWWHYVVVVVPEVLVEKETAVLYITGGKNTDGIPTSSSEDVLLCDSFATLTGAACVVLFQIPNQPIHFSADATHKSRSEDAIISWTWKSYIDSFNANQSNPELLALFPMTKAAVRTMDTGEIWLKNHNGIDISKWIVAGASKRGWTTWLTTAVDKRVSGSIPIVFDLLRLQPLMHNMWRNMGGWTWAFEDYWGLNLTQDIDTPAFLDMCKQIDPYYFFDRYVDVPKLVVSSSDDEFMQLDDDWNFWNELPGEKHRLFCQNTEHSEISGIPEIVPAVSSFAKKIFGQSPRPNITWEFKDDGYTVVVRSNSAETISSATLHCADTLNHTRRDFRWIVKQLPGGCKFPYFPVQNPFGGAKVCAQPIPWHKYNLTKIGDSEWLGSVGEAPGGWRACFAELKYFESEHHPSFVHTTQTTIVPGNQPYPSCHGKECHGALV